MKNSCHIIPRLQHNGALQIYSATAELPRFPLRFFMYKRNCSSTATLGNSSAAALRSATSLTCVAHASAFNVESERDGTLVAATADTFAGAMACCSSSPAESLVAATAESDSVATAGTSTASLCPLLRKQRTSYMSTSWHATMISCIQGSRNRNIK